MISRGISAPGLCFESSETMWRISFLFLIFLVSLPGQIVVLSHIRLIDGTGRPALEDASIVIAGGKIRAIGPASRIKTPQGAQVLSHIRST